MKNQNTIEAATLKRLLELMGFNETIADLRFLYKEIVHFVDVDAFLMEDQTSMYYFDEVTNLLTELDSIYGSNPNADDLGLIDIGLSIIEKIKGSANGDLIKYLENICDLALFHVDINRYDEKTRCALSSLRNVKEALTPLINDCFASEEIKMLKQQLRQCNDRIFELEAQIRRK